MKSRWVIVFAALLTVVGLTVAVLAAARRYRIESRLIELAAKDQAIQDAIRRTQSAAPVHLGGTPERESVRIATEIQPKTKQMEHPDVNAILAAHPELQAAYQKATAGRLHQTYDRLLKSMGLSDAQIEQAVSVMMRDDENEMDLKMTAEALKLTTDDPALRQVRREETLATQSALESLLGMQPYQALRNYDRALTMRATSEDVASMSAVSGSPMTGAQTERLTQVLAEASASFRDGGQPNLTSTDWDTVVVQASTFLTTPQVAALQAKVQQARAAAMLSQFYASNARH